MLLASSHTAIGNDHSMNFDDVFRWQIDWERDRTLAIKEQPLGKVGYPTLGAFGLLC